MIPWIDRGDPERARIADFVIDYYWGLDIGEVIIGRYDDDGGPLNRSRLRNEGAKKATGDVLFFVDADILLPEEQVQEAARLAAEAPGAVLPCDIFLTDARDSEVDEIIGGADFAPVHRRGEANLAFVGRSPRFLTSGTSDRLTRFAVKTSGVSTGSMRTSSVGARRIRTFSSVPSTRSLRCDWCTEDCCILASISTTVTGSPNTPGHAPSTSEFATARDPG